MKKILILFLAALILFSGCIGEKTVKKGDTISVNYTGSLHDGKVFDTNIESVAKQHDIIKPEYVPLKFTVGEPGMIEGFDEGVVGMKVGDKKILTIPPEKAYGPARPELINSYPVIQSIPTVFPRVIEVPINEFESYFGKEHKIGDIITTNSNINMTILNITSNVSLSYNFKIGEQIPSPGAPWNETVLKVDDKNITIAYSVKKGEIIQFENVPWTTTVVDVNSRNITLKHNAIPDTEIPTMFGTLVKVHFNETSIIMDQNHELAGKTLIFNVTLVSIDTGKADAGKAK
ncbi:peptidyl-prolyl cis-trans isomerase [groundwater metagenome]